jgi:hypothetical protein
VVNPSLKNSRPPIGLFGPSPLKKEVEGDYYYDDDDDGAV